MTELEAYREKSIRPSARALVSRGNSQAAPQLKSAKIILRYHSICGKTENTMRTPPHTILIAGNQGGGQRKSATIATLADALQSIGYTTAPIAIDSSANSMLQKLLPCTRHLFPLRDGAEGVYQAAYDSTADITIIDSPSCYAENLANPELLRLLAEGGARIIVGVIINTQSEHSLECGVQFAYPFAPYSPEYIVLAVNDRAIESNANSVLESPGGQTLVQLAQGRVIEFPVFSQRMLRDHNARPAVPSVHIAKATNPFEAVPWQSYHKKVLESVSQHAEWLTGKPIPTPATA